MACNITQTAKLEMARPPGRPKRANEVYKGVNNKYFGRSDQLLPDKFFHLGLPSMRNIDDGGEKQGKEKC